MKRPNKPKLKLESPPLRVEFCNAPERPEPRVTLQMEEIRDTSLAADLCRAILRASARATAKQEAKKEKRNDAA